MDVGHRLDVRGLDTHTELVTSLAKIPGEVPANATVSLCVDPGIRLAVFSDVYDVRVLRDGTPASGSVTVKGGITKVTYGVTVSQSKDVTDKLLGYLSRCPIIKTDDDINAIVGDPCVGKRKVLTIHTTSPTTPKVVIAEASSHLESNIMLVGSTGRATSRVGAPIAGPARPNILFYVIYYDDRTYKMVERYKDREYVKLVNNGSTKYFEANLFRYLSANRDEWRGRDYVGILSYSSERKIGMNIDAIYTKVVSLIRQHSHELITFVNWSPCPTVGASLHGRIGDIFDLVLPSLGMGFDLPIPYRQIPVFFCNYWVAQTLWMEKYVDFAVRFMEVLDGVGSPNLTMMLDSDSGYKGTLPAEKLVQMTGFPHYTHHCFVMERLPCLFFWKNGFTRPRRDSCLIQGFTHQQGSLAPDPPRRHRVRHPRSTT